VLSFIEKKLTFKPDALDHGGLSKLPHERVRFGHEYGLDLDGICYRGSQQIAILFIHGNRHNITKFADHYTLFSRLGVSFFAFDYPGYGTSKGEPSEAALYTSARAAFAFVSTHLGFPASAIVVYGCSLGGAVASELVQHAQPAALITESTFTNSKAIARHLYPLLPLWTLTPNRFRNDERFARLTLPTMVIHGDRDTVVPVRMAHELFARLQSPKKLSIIEGADHVNSIAVGAHQLRDEISTFLESHGLHYPPPSDSTPETRT
jgi:fermentation-respiration switch protein FrsA (DUF1100 family)